MKLFTKPTAKQSRIALITLAALLAGAAAGTLLRNDIPALITDKAERMSARIPTRIADLTRQSWSPNETLTGNILAASFAQNQRDWPMLEQYMSQIYSVLADDDFARLRMMLLALGAGQYERALNLAQDVEQNPSTQPTNDPDMLAEGRNLGTLILLANSVRSGEFEDANKHLNSITAAPLRSLLGHVLSGWMDAAMGKTLSPNIGDMAFLPAMHHALAAEWAGQNKTAVSIIDQIAQNPLTPEATQLIAAFYLRHDKPDSAQDVLKQGVINYPQDNDIKTMLTALEGGITQVKRDEWLYHLKGASAGIAQSLRDLAHYMSTEKSWDSALIFAQMGRMVRDDVPRLNLLIGTIYQEEGRYDEARTTFKSIKDGDPDYIDAQIRLAEMDAKLGNKDAATRALESLSAKYSNPRIAYALGELHRSHSNYAAAIRAYDRVIDMSDGQVDDGLWSVYFVRAMAHDETGNWDKAEADLKTALGYRPDNPHLLNYLGYSYADKGLHLTEAKNMIIKALTQMPVDPYIIDSLGWVYYREGDYNQSLLFLERAVSIKPYDPVMNDHLGDLYAKMGRTLEAKYQWRRALEYANAERDAKLIESAKKKIKEGLKD